MVPVIIIHGTIPTRYENISKAAISNPIKSTHKEQTPLQRNPAYADTSFTAIEPSEPEPENTQALANTEELAYAIVPLISCQSAATTTVPHALEN